jgi:alpha/beta superfamily hydrolase
MDFAARDNERDIAIHAVWCQGDDFVNPARFTKDTRISITELVGGDHFFSGQTKGLADAVASMIA